jgi:hypothetical protein
MVEQWQVATRASALPTAGSFTDLWSQPVVTDPRVGLATSLGIMVAAAAWLLAQFLFDAELAEALGMNRHFVTYLAIVVFVSSLAGALVFAQFHRVRSDLLAGRNVLAAWILDPAMFTEAAKLAEREDYAEKRGALLFILGFTTVIFAAFAIADPEAGPGMLGIGVAFAIIITASFLYGRRVARIQMQFRSGRIIVGRDGLMANDVLHVWAVPLTWLAGAELAEGPPANLGVSYVVLGRFGPLVQTVVLPVPEQALPLARRAALELNAARRAGRLPPA